MLHSRGTRPSDDRVVLVFSRRVHGSCVRRGAWGGGVLQLEGRGAGLPKGVELSRGVQGSLRGLRVAGPPLRGGNPAGLCRGEGRGWEFRVCPYLDLNPNHGFNKAALVGCWLFWATSPLVV